MDENADNILRQEKILGKQEKTRVVIDENLNIIDGEKLPVYESLTVLRYRTLKKNSALGWWSAVVLLEDHQKKQICYYRWKRKKKEWKRDKKLAIRCVEDWRALREAVESFLEGLV